MPAPRLSLADYRRLSPRKRQLHDLHWATTHANLPLQDTPMTLAVTWIMRSRLQTNALKHKPTTRPGLMITGVATRARPRPRARSPRYQRHLAGLDDINPTHLRRTAALHLCQMAAGGSIRQAALRLGLPDTSAAVERCHSSARAVHRWAKQRRDPYEFETAVHNLTDELEAGPDRIDYQQRRAALQDWCIDADTWAQLVAQLPDSPWPHRREPELGDRKRHSASIIVWARIAGSTCLPRTHSGISNPPQCVTPGG